MDRWIGWLLPLLVVIQAFFVGSTFQTRSLTLSVTCFFLVIGYFISLSKSQPSANVFESDPKRQGNDTDSWRGSRALRQLRRYIMWPTVFLAVLGGVLLRVSFHVSGNLNPVAMLMDSTAHGALWMTLVLWSFYPRRGHPSMLACGIILVLSTVTAGGVSQSLSGQLSAALATLIAYSLASRQILGIWQNESVLRSIRRRSKKQHRARHGKSDSMPPPALPTSTVSLSQEHGKSGVMFSVMALSFLLMTASAAGHLASAFVPGMQTELFDRLSESLEAVANQTIVGGSRFVRGSKLGSIRNHMLGEPAEPALRAYAENEPGYLRGTVFDRYAPSGRWSKASSMRKSEFSPSADLSSIAPRLVEPTGAATTKLQGDVSAPLDRLEVQPDGDSDLVGTIEVHNAPFKGRVTFTSLSTQWIEAAGEGIRLSHHNEVAGGINLAQPYVLGIGGQNPKQELTELRKLIMLAVPPSIYEDVKLITDDVCAGQLTAQTKARAIEDFFQDNFQYSLSGANIPRNVEPVVNFLQTRHPAHCEYFATAAAMMLRSVGVPTRYVTGYVVREFSDENEYWIARNRDAHAWVEAYDEIEEQWFPVEATTGRSYRTLRQSSGTAANESTIADGYKDENEDDSFMSKVFGWIFSFRATDSLTFIFRVAQLPLFCMVALLLWIRHRQKLRAGSDSIDLQSRQMLQRVDRRMRKYRLVRNPTETLHQFADRIEAAMETTAASLADRPSLLSLAPEWYRSFAASRYRGQMPEPMLEEKPKK